MEINPEENDGKGVKKVKGGKKQNLSDLDEFLNLLQDFPLSGRIIFSLQK